MQGDFYNILGVEKNASPEEIKKAYRKLVKESHPDKNPGDEEAVKKFKKVQEAYEVLSNPIERSRYDSGTRTKFNFTSKPQKQYSQSGFSSVFEEFFGGGSNRGRNIQIRVECELNEILIGCKKRISIKKRKRCNSCDGKGYSSFTPCFKCGGSGFSNKLDIASIQFTMQCEECQGSGKSSIDKCEGCNGEGFGGLDEKYLEIQIPKGIDNGMQIRIQGEGEEGVGIARVGDLFVVVLIKEHKLFKREGRDLYCDIPVSYTQLILGDEVELPTLDNSVVKVKIPSGTQTGTRFRMKGRGLPDVRMQHQLGDIIATVKVESPSLNDCNSEYKDILNKLSKFEKKHVTPKRKEYSNKIS